MVQDAKVLLNKKAYRVFKKVAIFGIIAFIVVVGYEKYLSIKAHHKIIKEMD